MNNMKKHIHQLVFSLVAFAVLAGGCKKDRPTLEPAGSKLDGIHAEWQLFEVQVVDVASLQEARIEVTEAFSNGDPMTMKFNSDNFTYEIVKGNSPSYFGDGGTWAFDDNEYPSEITLTTNGGKEIVLPLVRTIRPIDPYLNFSYQRLCSKEDKPYIGYEFKFVRSN